MESPLSGHRATHFIRIPHQSLLQKINRGNGCLTTYYFLLLFKHFVHHDKTITNINFLTRKNKTDNLTKKAGFMVFFKKVSTVQRFTPAIESPVKV